MQFFSSNVPGLCAEQSQCLPADLLECEQLESLPEQRSRVIRCGDDADNSTYELWYIQLVGRTCNCSRFLQLRTFLTFSHLRAIDHDQRLRRHDLRDFLLGLRLQFIEQRSPKCLLYQLHTYSKHLLPTLLVLTAIQCNLLPRNLLHINFAKSRQHHYHNNSSSSAWHQARYRFCRTSP